MTVFFSTHLLLSSVEEDHDYDLPDRTGRDRCYHHRQLLWTVNAEIRNVRRNRDEEYAPHRISRSRITYFTHRTERSVYNVTSAPLRKSLETRKHRRRRRVWAASVAIVDDRVALFHRSRCCCQGGKKEKKRKEKKKRRRLDRSYVGRIARLCTPAFIPSERIVLSCFFHRVPDCLCVYEKKRRKKED